MGSITKQLRQAADCAPLWRSIFEAAADEIERLQEDNNKIRGRMHDQWINQNKAKAEAVRGFLCENAPLFDDEDLDPEEHHCEFTLLEERKRIHNLANKLERGEL